MTEKQIYRHSDRASKTLHRAMESEFQRLAAAGFDENNFASVRDEVSQMYTRINRRVRTEMRRVAQHAYDDASEETEKKKRSLLPLAFILALLSGYDEVTKYVFKNEWLRKRDRLIEAIMAAQGSQAVREALKTGLNAIAYQVDQYLDNVTDKARIQAFEDAGIVYVKWNTKQDNRVCGECEERQGQIFNLEDLPPKHYHCRCWLTPAVVPKSE